ncbi:hypothetical protein RB195_001971 [Necator americanus]|uniref:aECM cysteine-cradle domain-containing protein n=1 Tax=Necator americanus TaxID=51031 RepID=A0ABR1DGS1_NECAM
MRLLHVQLVLFAASSWLVEAISNKLLEDYERKLNSVNEKLGAWRRTPGKHRLKRYRCIEEYVDEHGNVIEEGREHLTTPAPVNFASAPRRRTKNHRAYGVKNMVIDVPTKAARMQDLKVTMVKKKVKTMMNAKTKSRDQQSITDNETFMRVFPKTTTTTTSSPTTEIIDEADDSSDEVILKNFFEPSLEMKLQRPAKVEAAERLFSGLIESSAVATTLSAPPLRTPSTDFLETSDHSVDGDVSRDREKRLYRRHRKLGGVTTYSRGGEDYDMNYDDYNYVDDEFPFLGRRRVGGRRLRQYLGYPPIRYPGRRDARFTKVAPLLQSHYYATQQPLDVRPMPVVATSAPLVMQKRRSLTLSHPREYQLPPPPPTPLPPTPVQPPPLPLVAPPSPQSSALPLVAPLSSSQTLKMEESTPETCRRMSNLATMFGITDISTYARRNCRLLQAFAPGHTCEQITHFVDSCHKKRFS